MKNLKLIIMSCMAAALSFSYAASYAQESGSPIFLLGKFGSSAGLEGCPGNCRADPTGTIGVGFNFDLSKYDFASFSDSSPIKENASISLEYSQARFDVNGNRLDVQGRAINFAFEFSLKQHPEYVLALQIAPVWMTSSGPNIPKRNIATSGRGGVDLLYQVNPSLYLTVGTSSVAILSSNQPDFISRTVDVGLRWYP